MTTKEKMIKFMQDNNLKMIETENALVMLSDDERLRVIYYFNEKGDLVRRIVKNL